MIGTFADLGLRREAPANLDAGQAFDHPVEQDDVGHALLDEDECLFAVRSLADRKAFACEMPDDELGDRLVILDQQQVGLRHQPCSCSADAAPSGVSPRSRSSIRSPVTT